MSKIFDFVKPGVITGDDVQKVFQVAKENNFALPAVNCVGTDSINAVLETAAKVKAPVIVQFSNWVAPVVKKTAWTTATWTLLHCTPSRKTLITHTPN